MSDEKMRGIQKESERLKEEVKNLKSEQNHNSIMQHEQ